jgi:hypothetical protein
MEVRRMARVAPGERFRRELDELSARVDGEVDPVEWIGRLGAAEALDDELSEFLGRTRYERAVDPVSHRGYEPRTVVTTAGAVGLERPGLRDAHQLGFKSRILGRRVASTYAAQSLISARCCTGGRCVMATALATALSVSTYASGADASGAFTTIVLLTALTVLVPYFLSAAAMLD